MEWAKFKKDLKNCGYKKNKKYAIQLGDTKYIYVSLSPNSEYDTQVTRFRTTDQPELFDIIEE